MKRILAAVDGSEASMQAVELAAELATKFQAEFLLICVVEHGSPPDWALAEYVRPDQIGTDMGQFAVSFARDALENARARAVARGVDPVRSEIRVGDASEEIFEISGGNWGRCHHHRQSGARQARGYAARQRLPEDCQPGAVHGGHSTIEQGAPARPARHLIGY